jgi:hypothetical protein
MKSLFRWSGPLVACLLCLLLLPHPARAADPTARVTVYRGNLRDRPHIDHSTVLRILRQDDVVTLRGRLQDGSWIAVTTQDGVAGWVHHSLLALPAGDLPVLPGDPPASDAMPGMPLPTPTAPPPTPTMPMMQMGGATLAISGTITMADVLELPASDAVDVAVGPDAGATPFTITVRVCYDANANHACDEGEGVRGLTTIAERSDATIIATQPTDARGVAHLAVKAPANQPLTVGVPELGWTQQAQSEGSDVALQPLVIGDVIALPWPLP